MRVPDRHLVLISLTRDGRLAIVEDNLDECTLCELCLQAFPGKVKVVKINIDNNPKVPRQYAVRGIPTLMMFKNGAVHSTQVGAVGKSQLTSFVDKAV